MALLTDGNPNDSLALAVYESTILNLAHIENIDLGVKLTLATEEISEDVLDILLDHTRADDPQSTMRRTIGVTGVVVTAPMKRWHALHTLAVVYRDAFNNQLNDRYEAKLLEYRGLAQNARVHTIRLGIGLALNPLARAQAPTLSTVTGTANAGTFYVEMTWVSASGAEGAPSCATAMSTAALQNLVVQAANAPAGAIGFNVYSGSSANALALQNATPIAIGTTFTMPNAGLVAGAAPGTGQAPDIYVLGGPMLRRG
jgi:hypothetical protein